MFNGCPEFSHSLKDYYSDFAIDFASFSKKYRTCDASTCQQLCCAVGGFVSEDELQQINGLIRNREKAGDVEITESLITEGFSDKTLKQTALKDTHYRNEDVDFHQCCVFKQDNGYCGLQSLAISKKLHPWTYKPIDCWLFPVVFIKKNDHHELSVFGPDSGILYDEQWGRYPEYGSCLKPDKEGTQGYKLLENELKGLSELLERDVYGEIKNYCELKC